MNQIRAGRWTGDPRPQHRSPHANYGWIKDIWSVYCEPRYRVPFALMVIRRL